MARAAPHRVGEPSPLVLHLGAALSAYGHALLAAPRADSPGFPWAASLEVDRAALAGLDTIEVALEVAARLGATVRGLEIWQQHPYRRSLAAPPAVWRAGCSRLLDFGQAPEAARPDGPPVLVVPSLINRSYILDLAPGRSILRWLAGEGLRPLLVDWGEPGPEEADFDLAAYGARRLLPALARACEIAGRPVPLVGYCMGGTLAVGAAARVPEAVAALVTIGAPWDFAPAHGLAGGVRASIRAQGVARAEALLEAQAQAFGMIPVSLFQFLFALVNPIQAALKFQKLARLDPLGPAAELFVALEDWVADGVPMPLGAARDLLLRWQIENAPATGGWHFLGGAVDPARATQPALVFSGASDSIAPPPLALPLAQVLPRAELVSARTGHIGMIVGSAARSAVWRPLAAFLAAHGG
ncbi:alpha/beta fold hydrolase [Amaricoccus sp.]|uniref:alpha/beta fold hydrolase n=1 Tax=Amaricoccus sp. TaxID=1872485 RepID=UPI002630F647|nr:alpha/beta fold hydrolase [Amaricoccus sp.]HRO11319.1 dienelactone hydrolase family protein [Amaricoccus sp.]